MSYLYDESPAKERGAMEAHLQSCAECRANVAAWQGVARELSEWKLAAKHRRGQSPALARWAIAAAFVALAAIGGARIMVLDKQVKDLRAEIQKATRQDLSAALAQVSEQATKAANAEAQGLINDFAQQWEQKRVEDQQSTLTALQRMTARHAQDYAKLRKELETVAVFSEAGWERAQSQISHLAATPASFSDQQ
jgi:hypothetical protein